MRCVLYQVQNKKKLHNEKQQHGDKRRHIMASWLIAVVGVVYSVVAINLLVTGKVGLGIAFIGYAIGNIGLFMEARL